MKIDPFNTELLRIDSDLSREQFDVLTRSILFFRKAGGQISWTEWQQMDIGTKKAFVTVHEILKQEAAPPSPDAKAQEHLEEWTNKNAGTGIPPTNQD